MKIIDLEAHFYTRSYLQHLEKRTGIPRLDQEGDSRRLWYSEELWMPQNTLMESRYLELEEKRLKDMAETGVDRQFLSLNSPHVQLFEPAEGVFWSKKVNDEIAALIKKYPDKYTALATLAPQSPQAAADELDRAVTMLGFKGALIQSHACNEYLDARKYWPIWAKAAELDVPVYLHPAIPAQAILKGFLDYGQAFVSAPFGYAVETSLHAVRLIYSGLFDKYPTLKIILGHMGEGLPYWLYRLDFLWLKPRTNKKMPLERRPSEYIKENFYLTISGMYYQPALVCACMAVGADRIMYASDYPHENDAGALQFLKEAPICDFDKEKIGHLNAEKLFKL